jgi:hypothetical protein
MNTAKKSMIQGEALYNGNKVQILQVFEFQGKVDVSIVTRDSENNVVVEWVKMTSLNQIVWFA